MSFHLHKTIPAQKWDLKHWIDAIDTYHIFYKKRSAWWTAIKKVKKCIHTLRTRFAPRLKPCAETARLSEQAHKRQQTKPSVPTKLSCGGTSARPSSNPDMQHPIHTCLILQCLQPLSSLCDLCDVFSHDTNGVVNLGLNSGCLRVSLAWASGSRSRRGAVSR